MRTKLQNIIRGKSEETEHEIIFESPKLRFSVVEDGIFHGSFSFYSKDGSILRGLVSSPDPDLTCQTPKFDGKRCSILFEYHAEKMAEGEEREGYFVLTTNAGEVLYPYRVKSTKNYAHTSIGWIRNLTDFTNLAQLNWKEAYQLFSSGRFAQIFHRGEEENRDLYYALINRGLHPSAMEEFLIGTGKKKRIDFSIKESNQTFVVGETPITEEIAVEKTEWGYLQLRASASSPFVQISVNQSDEDCSSRHMSIEYTILPQKMHAGKNYARIVLEGLRQQYAIEITAVWKDGKNLNAQKNSRHAQSVMLRTYIDYRLGRMEKEEWCQRELEILDQIDETKTAESWNVLYRAFLYLNMDRRQEASDILDEFSSHGEFRRTPAEGFYQYLTSFFHTEPDYRSDVVFYIRDLYRQYHFHPVLAYLLLTMDTALTRNEERRYLFLKKYMTEYSSSPLFYLESYLLIRDYPQLLNRPGEFELRLIHWMMREDLQVEGMDQIVADAASSVSGFRPFLFEMLTGMYENGHSRNMLKSICRYLIKTGHFEHKYAVWYRKGVESRVKVAGLYEAFLRSDADRDGTIPPEVLKYFILQPSVPWRWRARIYSCILSEKDQKDADFISCQSKIREFAADGLKKGYLNDDMCRIYSYLKSSVSEEEWRQLSRGLNHAFRIETDSDRMATLYVMDPRQRQMAGMPLKNRCSFVRLNTGRPVMVLQDVFGCMHVLRDLATVRPLSDDGIRQQEDGRAEKKDESEQNRRRQEQLIRSLEEFSDSIDRMDARIQEAKKTDIYTLPFEEKILVRMLFTGHFTPSHPEYFADVAGQEKNRDTLLCDAYVSWFGRQFLLGKEKLTAPAAEYILSSYQNERRLNDYCQAAFLKYQYTVPGEKTLSPRAAGTMLRNIILNGWQFDFFNDLPEDVRCRYLMDGCLFIQFHGRENRKYRIRTEESLMQNQQTIQRTYVMHESLPGIYCTGIPVFPGSRLHYAVMDEQDQICQEDTVSVSDHLFAGDEITGYHRMVQLFSEDSINDSSLQHFAGLLDQTVEMFKPAEEEL